jgi:hypothetical protein
VTNTPNIGSNVTVTTTSTESDGINNNANSSLLLLLLQEQQQKDQNQQQKNDKRREQKHKKKRAEKQKLKKEKQQEQRLRQQYQKNITTPTKFKRFDDVVIVTKIHGVEVDWRRIKQSLCLLHHAYNSKVEYPILIFTTIPIPERDIQELQSLLGDKIQISVVVDNNYEGSLQQMIYALPAKKRNKFLNNCNVTSPEELRWSSKCPNNNNGNHPSNIQLSYNWQAEFRSVHIWNHHSLMNYKYMFWIDSDGFATAPWMNDPVEYLIENNGVVMFDNLQGGTTKELYNLIFKSYNNSFICDMKINTTTGYIERRLIDHIPKPQYAKSCTQRIHTIHGFFHITDLDFYRSHVSKFLPLMGDCFLCRNPDDQLAVTLPAIYYKPHKAFDMRSSGYNLKVFHNYLIDGKVKEKAKPGPGFVKYWKNVSKYNFPEEVNEICPITEIG